MSSFNGNSTYNALFRETMKNIFEESVKYYSIWAQKAKINKILNGPIKNKESKESKESKEPILTFNKRKRSGSTSSEILEQEMEHRSKQIKFEENKTLIFKNDDDWLDNKQWNKVDKSTSFFNSYEVETYDDWLKSDDEDEPISYSILDNEVEVEEEVQEVQEVVKKEVKVTAKEIIQELTEEQKNKYVKPSCILTKKISNVCLLKYKFNISSLDNFANEPTWKQIEQLEYFNKIFELEKIYNKDIQIIKDCLINYMNTNNLDKLEFKYNFISVKIVLKRGQIFLKNIPKNVQKEIKDKLIVKKKEGAQ